MQQGRDLKADLEICNKATPGPNTYDIYGDTVCLYIKKPNHNDFLAVLLNLADLDRVRSIGYKWRAAYYPKDSKYRVVTRVNGKRVHLSRFILDAQAGQYVDHINHDTLDNRRTNLRLLTNSENMQNRSGQCKSNKSGYRNVFWDKRRGKWRVEMQSQWKHIFGGYFTELQDAITKAEEMRKENMPYA